MTSFRKTAFVVLPALLSFGCGTSDSAAPTDSGADTFDEAFVHPDSTDDNAPPLDTAPVRHCTLDNGTDPVGLCIQKVVFQQWHDAALIKSLGIAQSWDSTSFLPDKSSSGAVLHDARDDVLFAAAAARYLSSAATYGDTEITQQTSDDFNFVVAKIETELATPDGSDVELYGELRVVSSQLRLFGDLANADKIDAIADAVGNAVYDQSWHELGAIPPPPPTDAGDAGDAGADATVDAIADSTTPDAASDAPDVPLVDGILGAPATGGGFDYVTWKAAYGAAALLDMVVRHPSDAKSSGWQRAAIATFDHLLRRARNTTPNLLFAELVTSSDPDHDKLAGAAPSDALLTDVQAATALALSRAQETVDTNKIAFAPTVVAYPFASSGAVIVEATESVPLWDADKGGYLDGWLPASSATIPRKSTRANALMLAAIHRLNVRASAPKTSAHRKGLRTLLLQRTPEKSSLLSVFLDQASYFVATSPSFDFAGLTDPRAKSLFTSANAIACEGLDAQWFGLPR